MAGSDVSGIIYQEQEKLLIRRGELEDGFVTKAKPIEATVIKVRGTSKAGGFGKRSTASGSGGGKASSKAEGEAHTKILKWEGVLQIDDVLPPNTADAVQEHLYDLRARSMEDVAAGRIQLTQRFANVLRRTNWCDLTLPLREDEIVTRALHESLCRSPVGATVSSMFGVQAQCMGISAGLNAWLWTP